MNPDVHPLSASIPGGESGASYEIIGKLATGGMAELFLARAPGARGGRGPVVVLKRILPHLAEDPEFIRMFRDEAYLAATLQHPNIVRVFDLGRQGEDYFFTMEYVHGENLRAILRAAQKRGESIPLAHILTIALGITAALHHAHEQTDDQGRPLQIVHRDVSPTNVLVAYDGSVKIVDFGIAKAAAGTHVTQAGMLKGKASYMSPEQCRASTVDRRSDVFAIGILLYEMTTLTRLFKGDNELAILHQVLSGTVERPSSRRPGYPPELERIVLRALAADPDQRYPNAQELQNDIMRFGQQNGLRPSNPSLGQFLRGLFGNKPLPWSEDEAPDPVESASVNLVGRRQPGVDENDLTVTRDGAGPPEPSPPPRPPAPQRPARPAARPAARPTARPTARRAAPRPSPPGRPPAPPPRPASAPQPGGPRPARGPSRGRASGATAWRPGGRKPPQPPPGASGAMTTEKRLPSSAATPTGPHAASRPTAPRGSPAVRPSAAAAAPAAPAAAPAAPAAAARSGPPGPAQRPRRSPPSAAASYAPPPPDYDLDPEDSKTQVAGQTYDPSQEAKTTVSGTTADAVRAFMAAAPAADLGRSEEAPSASATMAAKTQVAPTSADAVRAFIAAAPPAELAPSQAATMAAKTQVAPASAAEIAALTAAADRAIAASSQPDQRPDQLFAAPAPPTRPGVNLPKPPPDPALAGRTMPPSARPPSAQPRPAPAPPPADLPPPAAQARPAAPPRPAPSDLPPPGGVVRHDTIMNAPAQPVALGGAGPSTAPPAARGGASPADDLDDAATIRMSTDHVAALRAGAPGGAPQQQQPAQPQQAQAQPQGAPNLHLQPVAPGPSQHWPGHPQPPPSHTLPMPLADLDDEPIVVPGRNSKLIAMVITVVIGVSVGAAGVWFFVLSG